MGQSPLVPSTKILLLMDVTDSMNSILIRNLSQNNQGDQD